MLSRRAPSYLWLGAEPQSLVPLHSLPAIFRLIPVRRKIHAWDCKVTPAGCACQEGNTTGCIPNNDGLDAGVRDGFSTPRKTCSFEIRGGTPQKSAFSLRLLSHIRLRAEARGSRQGCGNFRTAAAWSLRTGSCRMASRPSAFGRAEMVSASRSVSSRGFPSLTCSIWSASKCMRSISRGLIGPAILRAGDPSPDDLSSNERCLHELCLEELAWLNICLIEVGFEDRRKPIMVWPVRGSSNGCMGT